MGKKEADKGAATEEVLRGYFLRQGYFVVRGVKVTHEGLDVTDVDLWLYMRSSALLRQRIAVDAKDKRTPKAMERILWAKGVQNILKLEACIVATTDKRAAVKSFGRQSGVLVLDGEFLARLRASNAEHSGYLTSEEFEAICLPKGDEKMVRDWRKRFEEGRSRLVTSMDFAGAVGALEDIEHFLHASMPSAMRRTEALRLLYVSISNLLITLDWMMGEISFKTKDERMKVLDDGFRYGERGLDGWEELLRDGEELLKTYHPDMKGAGASVRKRAMAELAAIPSPILAEYFSKVDVQQNLFVSALEFDKAAFSKTVSEPKDMSAMTQGILGCLIDFHQVARKDFLST